MRAATATAAGRASPSRSSGTILSASTVNAASNELFHGFSHDLAPEIFGAQHALCHLITWKQLLCTFWKTSLR